MTRRERLSATVEGDLLDAGRQAVADGRADSLSAGVNDALRRQAEHDQRMTALDEFLTQYEAAHGEITAAEIQEATRTTQRRGVVAQPRAARGSSARKPGAA